MRNRIDTPGDQRGFTLLEVLIAGVIAALALGVLFRSGLDGLIVTRVSDNTAQAVALAQSHLTLASAEVAGDQLVTASGQDGMFRWRTRIVPAAFSAPSGSMIDFVRQEHQARVRLYAVTAEISWIEGLRHHAVRLDTQQAGVTTP